MKQYVIINKENPKQFYCTNEESAFLMYRWTDDIRSADVFTLNEGEKTLSRINQAKIVGMLIKATTEGEVKKINVDDLNGIGEQMVMKVITKTLQEYDPMKFSLKCEEEFTKINQEAMICYQVNTVPMQTPQGVLMIFIATWQYWGSESEYKAWETDLRRSKLLIKQ